MGSHGTRSWVAIAHQAQQIQEGLDRVAAGTLQLEELATARTALREALEGVPTPAPRAGVSPQPEITHSGPMVERFRAALMRRHADDWDMDTVAEAAYVCAAELTVTRQQIWDAVEGRLEWGDKPWAIAEYAAITDAVWALLVGTATGFKPGDKVRHRDGEAEWTLVRPSEDVSHVPGQWLVECSSPPATNPVSTWIVPSDPEWVRVADGATPRATRDDIVTVLEGVIAEDCTTDAFKAAERQLAALLDADPREVVFRGTVADWENPSPDSGDWPKAVLDGKWLVDPAATVGREVHVVADGATPAGPETFCSTCGELADLHPEDTPADVGATPAEDDQ